MGSWLPVENVKHVRKRRHAVKNLSLKWSFVLYVLVCTATAFILSLVSASIFAQRRNDLYLSLEASSLPTQGFSEAAGQDGNDADENTVHIYSMSGDRNISADDVRKIAFYGWMSFLTIPVIALLCILFTGILFYHRKLKKPLKLFDDASARIAAGDLDFSIAYDNRNEMGRLAQSFDAMRAGLMENNRKMWRMIEQRKQLNAAFAHDLRTPLTVLRGYTEYLSAYIPQKRVPEEKLLSTVQLMHAYVLRLEGYTASMSMLQNLEEVKPNRQHISFTDLSKRLKGAADMLRGSQTLYYQFLGEGEVYADPDLITQVLENMVANAVRFTKTRIDIFAALNGELLTLTVTDDGPGFSDKTLRKGIAPYQSRKEEDVHSGHFGLGLYICSMLCRCHGGSVFIGNDGGAKVTAVFDCRL
jgi:signal transduction histidine kinase